MPVDALDPVRPVRRGRPGARRRTRSCGRRRTPRRPGSPGSRCAAGRWPARGRCSAPAAGGCARARRWRCAAGRPRRAGRRARGPRSRKRIAGGIVSAGLLPTSTSDVGLRDVVERERQPAVDPERAGAGGDGRRHAEPAVVVDVAAAQRDADELAELVGLLVGQPAPAERADGVAAVRGLRAGDRRGDPVERVVPARGRGTGRRGSPGRAGWSAVPGGRAARRRWRP